MTYWNTAHRNPIGGPIAPPLVSHSVRKILRPLGPFVDQCHGLQREGPVATPALSSARREEAHWYYKGGSRQSRDQSEDRLRLSVRDVLILTSVREPRIFF
jgi:hypothetical protein